MYSTNLDPFSPLRHGSLDPLAPTAVHRDGQEALLKH